MGAWEEVKRADSCSSLLKSSMGSTCAAADAAQDLQEKLVGLRQSTEALPTTAASSPLLDFFSGNAAGVKSCVGNLLGRVEEAQQLALSVLELNLRNAAVSEKLREVMCRQMLGWSLCVVNDKTLQRIAFQAFKCRPQARMLAEEFEAFPDNVEEDVGNILKQGCNDGDTGGSYAGVCAPQPERKCAQSAPRELFEELDAPSKSSVGTQTSWCPTTPDLGIPYSAHNLQLCSTEVPQLTALGRICNNLSRWRRERSEGRLSPSPLQETLANAARNISRH